MKRKNNSLKQNDGNKNLKDGAHDTKGINLKKKTKFNVISLKDKSKKLGVLSKQKFHNHKMKFKINSSLYNENKTSKYPKLNKNNDKNSRDNNANTCGSKITKDSTSLFNSKEALCLLTSDEDTAQEKTEARELIETMRNLKEESKELTRSSDFLKGIHSQLLVKVSSLISSVPLQHQQNYR